MDPHAGYRPRRADPRTGTFTNTYYDYSTKLEDQVRQPRALRHRLEYREEGNPESGVKAPIVFYVDPGAPEAIRQALAKEDREMAETHWADALSSMEPQKHWVCFA